MKKLLLISGFLFSGGLFANMDNMCVVVEDYTKAELYISKNCERNNVLIIYRVPNLFTSINVAKWCRHDREITILPWNEGSFTITCVLYDKQPRK
jgi:hypothetical protein